jgi:hypothetical protein
MSSSARLHVFDLPEVPSRASKQLSSRSWNFESASDCFQPAGAMSELDIPRAQRRGRRKIQASAQDLLILVE